jgi:putative flavoprotein involved in K+ transport
VIGMPWLYTWGSGRFVGIGRDAEFVVGALKARAEGKDERQAA